MSYVLTEIALEMMGFKLYDVHGNPIPMQLSKDDSSDTDEMEEESFWDICDIPNPCKNPEKKKKPNTEPSVLPSGKDTTAETPSEPVVINAALINDEDIESSVLDAGTTEHENITIEPHLVQGGAEVASSVETYAERLQKECDKINEEINGNQAKYIRANQSKLKIFECDKDYVPDNLTKMFIASEKNKILSDHKTLKFFRKQVEKNIANINQSLYRDYLRTIQIQENKQPASEIKGANAEGRSAAKDNCPSASQAEGPSTSKGAAFN